MREIKFRAVPPAFSKEEDMMIKEWVKIYSPHDPYNPSKGLSNFQITAMVKKYIERVSKKIVLKERTKP